MPPIFFFVVFFVLMPVSVISCNIFIDDDKYYIEKAIQVDYAARKIQLNCGDEPLSIIAANNHEATLKKALKFKAQRPEDVPNWIGVDGIHNVEKTQNNSDWLVTFNFINFGIYAPGDKITDIKTAALEFHNQQRAKHGCDPLELDLTLSNDAQQYAEEWAKTKGLPPINNERNFATEEYTSQVPDCGAPRQLELIKSWYENGLKKYNYDLDKLDATAIGKMSYDSASFINMVWKETTKVGFGIFYDIPQDGNTIYWTLYIVARYNTTALPRTKETLQQNILKPE